MNQYNNSDWEDAKDMAEALDATPIWKAMLAAAAPPSLPDASTRSTQE